MIGGAPVYGDEALMKQLLPNQPIETITICGEAKALHIVDNLAAKESWSKTLERLTAVMKPLGIAPSPLVSCAQP
jgi:hypothetical protein